MEPSCTLKTEQSAHRYTSRRVSLRMVDPMGNELPLASILSTSCYGLPLTWGELGAVRQPYKQRRLGAGTVCQDGLCCACCQGRVNMATERIPMKSNQQKSASSLSTPATYSFDNRRFLVTTAFCNNSGVKISELLLRIIVNDVKAPSATNDKTAAKY